MTTVRFWHLDERRGVVPDVPSNHGLVELREIMRKAGLRGKERQLTFAISNGRVELQLLQGNLGERLQAWFQKLFFGWTCHWGMSPGRCLWLVLGGIFFFSFAYTSALESPSETSGIWKVWPEDRVLEKQGSKEPEKLTPDTTSAYWWGFYFSVLSAFHFGWRDLNVGNWIARIQSKEYTLRATGWPRVVSGIQSLISVYLIALWALTYFGRPFE